MKILRFTLITELIFFIAVVLFLARPNVNIQLILMLSSLCLAVGWLMMVVSIGIVRDKAYRLKGLGVLLIAPLTLYIGSNIGSALRDHLFYRDLPRMKEVVALVQSGKIPLSKAVVALPAPYQSLAYGYRARRESPTILTVEFAVGGGFPVKHLAYLYRSDDVIPSTLREHWPRGRRREKCWFEVSD